MREQDDAGALVGQFLDGRDDAFEAGVVRDAATLDRDIEIDADEDAFAFDVDVIKGAEAGGHGRAPIMYSRFDLWDPCRWVAL